MENSYTILNKENKSIEIAFELEENNEIPHLDMLVQCSQHIKS